MQDESSLNDEDLEAEIRLVGDLVLAASQSEGRLSESEIDAVLGLDPIGPDAPPHTAGSGGEPGGLPKASRAS